MKKYIISLFLVVFLLAPALSKAQEEDIDPNPNESECVVLVNNLKYKSRDINTNGEVSTLQDFLQSRGYLNSEPTGYFGINTGKAVKNFQKDSNLAQTGYVGSLTRAKIRALTCGGEIVDTTNVCCEMFGYGAYMTRTPSVYEMMPKNKCLEQVPGGGRNVVDNSFCKMDINKPVISGISGPQTLGVNQTGTWTVSAYDKNGGNLSYSVNWGDEVISEGRDIGMLKYENTFQQLATFTHSYSQSGTFLATFSAKNSNGQITKKSLNIKVGDELLVLDTTPRIMYWWGKVNQHVDSNGNWLTDPDGTSGANLDKLTYCKKWFPNTTSVEDYKNETTNTWRNAGNTDGPFTSIKMSTKCVQGTAVPSITVFSPNGGEMINVSNPITVTFKSNNAYPAKHYINISDESIGKSYSLDSLLGSYGVSFSQSQINQSQQSVTVSIPESYNLDVNHNYKIEICVNNVCDKSDNYFRIINSSSTVPVISGISGPQTLGVNQTGTWTVSASDKSGSNLSYSVRWGDETVCSNGVCSSNALAILPQQSGTFTHSYSKAGTYNPTFTVTNINGQSATTSLSVIITNLGKYDTLATCIKDSGAVLYGTFWCSHCQNQKNIFGSSANLLPYVECSAADGKGQAQVCKDENITGYPTWIFGDGSVLAGEQPLQKLASKTSCALPN